jgi:L-lactate dehydrogenase complex protein LldG
MNSRESILSKINALAQIGAEHPGDFQVNISELGDHVEEFQNSLAVVGAISKLVSNESIDEAIQEIHPGKFVFTSDKVLENGLALSDVDVLLIQGKLGVAENGAIWISEDQLPHRVAPFICQHLVIQIAKENLVATMHAAYKVLGFQNPGFGLFLAGPSKTADIEQSLVIGAHGARSLAVLIIETRVSGL